MIIAHLFYFVKEKSEKIITARDAQCDRKSLGEKKSTKTPDRSY